MSKTIILIPSRLDASRLPNKPLLKINNKSLINHVYEKGLSTKIGEVYVATGDREVFEEVKQNKGKSILTSKEHKGDEPLLDIKDIINLKNFAVKKNSKIATLACKLESKNFENESVVKVRCKNNLEKNKISCAQEFLRFADKKNSKNIYHHIGIYIYEVSILKKFVSMNQSSNEINLRLEQLRALDDNIRIDVVFAKSSSIGVDTQEDYMEIKKLMEYKS